MKDLAIIDMRLRYLLMHMALDIEHFAKVRLMSCIENAEQEDGYSIVSDFLDSLDDKQRSDCEAEISRNKNNPYCGPIIQKYDGDYPAWAFVEIIPFGRLVAFHKICAERFKNKSLLDQHYLMLPVRELRNAVAHNSCLLNDLTPDTSKYRTNNAVSMALGHLVSKEVHRRKMSNVRLQQIVTLLFVHKETVTSPGVRERRCSELKEFLTRMSRNGYYYEENERNQTTFDFLRVVIDNWFPVV